MNSPTPTTCWTTWPSGSSPNAAQRRPGVGGGQQAGNRPGVRIGHPVSRHDDHCESADRRHGRPPVPPRSDNYLHYTGDVGGLLGVRRPHRVQYRIGIETPQSTPGRKAPSTFTVDRRRNCHQRCLRNFEAAQVASHYYKTEHIGSLTQFGEFTAARADHKVMEPSVDRLPQYVELIRRFAKVSWRAR